jgi:hypothetical protein
MHIAGFAAPHKEEVPVLIIVDKTEHGLDDTAA